MPKGIKTVDLDNVAANTILSNNVLHNDIKPRVLFILGKEPNADGLTRSWGTIAKNFRIIQDILDATQGQVPKQAQLVKQFIKWLEDHGVKWNWSDADKSIQHLRSQLRTVFHHSAPPAKAPRAFPQLQILIDKCAAARAREEPEVEVIDVPKPLVKRIRVESDDDNSQFKKKHLRSAGNSKQKLTKTSTVSFWRLHNNFQQHFLDLEHFEAPHLVHVHWLHHLRPR